MQNLFSFKLFFGPTKLMKQISESYVKKLLNAALQSPPAHLLLV